MQRVLLIQSTTVWYWVLEIIQCLCTWDFLALTTELPCQLYTSSVAETFCDTIEGTL